MAMVESKVVPLRRRQERRSADRFEMELPLAVAGAQGGVTRNLSLTGLAFTARQPFVLGEQVEVTFEYLLDGHNFPLHCRAEVVRCEPCEGGFTVGARLESAFLD